MQRSNSRNVQTAGQHFSFLIDDSHWSVRTLPQTNFTKLFQDNFSLLLSELFHDGGITQVWLIVECTAQSAMHRMHTILMYSIHCTAQPTLLDKKCPPPPPQERVLVLFFFCSDLAVRCVRAGLRAVLARITR